MFIGENIKEVSERTKKCFIDAYNIITTEIGGKLKPITFSKFPPVTYGIHISFGGDLFPLAKDIITYQLKEKPTPSLRHLFLSDIWRVHNENSFEKRRIEYRKFSSSPEDIGKVISFLDNLQDY